MKKIFFLTVLVLGTMAASVNAQTLSSSTVDVRYCFTTSSQETVVENCATSYLWVDESGRKADTTITTMGTYDYVRTLINARGCDSIATLHLTLEDHRSGEKHEMIELCVGKPLIFDNETIEAHPTTGTYYAYSINEDGCQHTDTLPVTMITCVPEGVASPKAVFSVSKTQKVYFSQGNLVFTNTADMRTCKDGTSKKGIFSFADNQYTVGSKFTNGSSGVSSSYPPAGTSAGYNKAVTGTDYDWGVYNPISNGGDTPNMWRTLTGTEWTYLMGRTDENKNNKYGVGYIKESTSDKTKQYIGVILLPDDWTLPVGCTFTPFNSGATSTSQSNSKKYTANAYTLEQWSAMEEAGAVFMYVTTVNNKSSYYYWNGSYNLFYISISSDVMSISKEYSTSNVSGPTTKSSVRLVANKPE